MTAEWAEFLRERDPDGALLFLLTGFLAPHFSLVAPFENYGKYHGEVPPPELPEGLVETLPTNYEQFRRGFGIVDLDHEGDEVRFARELYRAFVKWFDA